MKYTLLALTTLLTLFSALPAKAGRVEVYTSPYYRGVREEVVVRRCYDNDGYYYDNDGYYNRPGVYGCRERVIRRHPRYRPYRVYRRYDYPYRYRVYDNNDYRYRRPGVRIQFGY